MTVTASVQLPSSLTLPQAREALEHIQKTVLGQAVNEQPGSGDAVVIDGSPLEHLDSAAIAVLLQCRRDAMARGKRLHLRSAPEKLLALMRLYGVADLFVEPEPVSGH